MTLKFKSIKVWEPTTSNETKDKSIHNPEKVHFN